MKIKRATVAAGSELDDSTVALSQFSDELSMQETGGLLSRAQLGDGQAFSALVEPHFRQLYRVALRITRNHEDAEDVCQDSMLKALKHISGFEGKSRFSTWLMRIGMNEALMKLRKRRREARHLTTSTGDLPEIPYVARIPDKRTAANPMAAFANSERIAILWGAFRQLEAKSQSAVCTYGLRDTHTQTTAESSGLSKSGMKSRFSRAVGQLRTIVDRELTKRSSPISEQA